MLFCFFIFILIFLLDCRPSFSFIRNNTEYLAKENVVPIKGFLVILVFFSHFKSYASPIILNTLYGNIFIRVFDVIGQLMVAPFFFYSGYGIYEQFKKKNNEYIKSFIKHRFLPIYVSFVICILFFVILNIFINKNFSLARILLSFTGWTNIGNSNWFMFDTFCFYLLFYFCFSITKNQNKYTQICLFGLANIILIVVLFITKENYWWDTGLCLLLGMLYSFNKEKIERELFNVKKWILVFISTLIFLFVFFELANFNHIFYIVYSLFFCFLLCLLQMRFKLRKSYFFNFLGKHVFSIYILQRIPFILFSKSIISQNVYLFFVLSFLITIFIAYLYDFLFEKVKAGITDK